MSARSLQEVSMPRHLALTLTVALLAAACGTTTATRPSSSPSAQACAWPEWAAVATGNSPNSLLPDAAASYWMLPFTVQSGLQITVAGRYPDARYASLQVYSPAAALFAVNGVRSSLTDYQIAPDAGSVNPWQKPARPGGRFTVTLRTDVSTNDVNTLPLSPDGTAAGSRGYLQYRVYLPAGGDFSKVVPPAVTLHQGGSTVAMAPCHGSSLSPTKAPPASAGTAAPATPATNAVPAPLKFFRVATDQAPFPNADSTYILTYVTPPAAADVVVIAGRAPRASAGDHPSPWPAPDRDMRYWSMCTYVGSGALPVVVNRLVGGAVDTGCRSDEASRLDSSGNYLYVVGTEAQRGAIDGIPGATFLPFSSAQPTARHLIMLRNMLVSPGFAYSTRGVPPSDPSAAAAVMGAYYPRAAVCSLSTLAARGPAGCLPAS
jgi:hypothetical protein